jgi:anti-sigma regulatory factor (Ser/Thr protein kinase)
LALLRGEVAAHGDRLGLPTERLSDLLLVAHEMASNAIQHGGGHGRLHLWCQDGVVYCRVADSGPGFSTALRLGVRAPATGAQRGRGLWLIRQLSDEVDIQTGPGGTVVTIAMWLDGSLVEWEPTS